MLSREAAIRRHCVNITGQGQQTLLFAHGFGCGQHMWRHVAPAFEHDHRVVCFDHIGSGRSDLSAYDSRRHRRLDGYATDLNMLCEALDLSDICYVGHSVGAMIGLLAAVRQPDRFQRMVFVAPSACYLNDPPYMGGFDRSDLCGIVEMMERNYPGWADALAKTVVQNEDRPELAEELRESFCNTDPRVAREFARATFFADHRSEVPLLQVPSLVMQCKDDVVAPESAGRYLHDHLPFSQLALMAASGHCPQLSHPRETIGQIARFLNVDLGVAEGTSSFVQAS